MDNLEKEAKNIIKLLKKKVIFKVFRHRKTEILIEFEDGTRFFINSTPSGMDFSITEGNTNNNS